MPSRKASIVPCVERTRPLKAGESTSLRSRQSNQVGSWSGHRNVPKYLLCQTSDQAFTKLGRDHRVASGRARFAEHQLHEVLRVQARAPCATILARLAVLCTGSCLQSCYSEYGLSETACSNPHECIDLCSSCLRLRLLGPEYVRLAPEGCAANWQRARSSFCTTLDERLPWLRQIEAGKV